MEIIGSASGIALLLVALLTIGLLVPNWVREHNARQAQRHAIRLQQTIRALAETSDRPEILELEARARTVRAQRRELRRAEQAEAQAERERARLEADRREHEARLATERAEQELREAQARAEAWRLAAELRESRLEQERAVAEAEMADAHARRMAVERARAAAEREAAQQDQAASAEQRWANGASGAERAERRRHESALSQAHRARAAKLAAERRRRGKLASTGSGLVGLLVAVLGAVIVGGAPGVGATVFAIGAATLAIAGWMLHRLNLVAAAQPAREAEEPASVPASIVEPAEREPEFVIHDIEPQVTVTAAAAPAAAWTPVPLPKPLYLQRATADELPPTDPTDPDGPGRGEDEVDRDLAALLREEAAKSAQALRDAHRAAEGARFGGRAESRVPDASVIGPITVGTAGWDSIGDLEILAGEYRGGDCDDLDAILRRRRAS